MVAHIGLTDAPIRPSDERLQGAGQVGRRIHHLIKDALALEAAGAFAVVLEGMPGKWPGASLPLSTFPPSASERDLGLRWTNPGVARPHQPVVSPPRRSLSAAMATPPP